MSLYSDADLGGAWDDDGAEAAWVRRRSLAGQTHLRQFPEDVDAPEPDDETEDETADARLRAVVAWERSLRAARIEALYAAPDDRRTGDDGRCAVCGGHHGTLAAGVCPRCMDEQDASAREGR